MKLSQFLTYTAILPFMASGLSPSSIIISSRNIQRVGSSSNNNVAVAHNAIIRPSMMQMQGGTSPRYYKFNTIFGKEIQCSSKTTPHYSATALHMALGGNYLENMNNNDDDDQDDKPNGWGFGPAGGAAVNRDGGSLGSSSNSNSNTRSGGGNNDSNRNGNENNYGIGGGGGGPSGGGGGGGGVPKVVPIRQPQDLLDFVVQDERLSVVKVYASWCKTCQAFDVRYRKLASKLGDKYNNSRSTQPNTKGQVRFAEMQFDDPNNEEMCRLLNATKLPYILMYKGSKGKVADFQCGPATFQTLIDAVNDHVDADERSSSVSSPSITTTTAMGSGPDQDDWQAIREQQQIRNQVVRQEQRTAQYGSAGSIENYSTSSSQGAVDSTRLLKLKDAEISRLYTELSNLRKSFDQQILRIKEENSRETGDLSDRIRAQTQEYERERRMLSDQIEQLSREMMDREKSLHAVENEISQRLRNEMKGKDEEYKETLTSLNIRIGELTRDLSKAQNELRYNTNASSNDQQRLQAHIVNMENEIKTLTSKNEHLEKELIEEKRVVVASTEEASRVLRQLEKIKSNEDEERKQLIARIGEMEAEIAEREMQMINMNSNNNGNEELAKELQEEMDHLKRKHERESNLMSNRIAELEEELAASWQSSSSSNDAQSRKIQELRRDMSDNADKILELENEIDERDKLLRTSNKATDILLDNMEAQKREYEKELDRTASLVNELEEAIANREEEMSTLQERFEALERLAGELKRREVAREEEAAAAAEANAASNQFQFANAMRMSEGNMGQQQQVGMGMGMGGPSPMDESSGEGNQQWQMEREARLAAEQEVGKLMGYLKDREQQINQMQQQQGGSQQGGSEGNTSPFGAFGALFGVGGGGGGGEANAQQNQQNWGNWQPNNEESMENYEMLNQVLMPDEVSQRGGQQSTQMPGAGRSENIWEGAPAGAGAGAGRSENIWEGADAGASSFMSGAGRSDNIRDGMGSASFGATPSPSAVATPSGGQLPTPAMAFERRIAENPIVPSGAFGGSKPTASFFSKTSNQGSGGGVPTDTPEYYQNAMNNFDSRPLNRGDSMEAPAMPPIESFQQRPTAPSPRQAARPGATESIYAGAGSASDNIYAGAGSASASAYPRPSPARQEPPAPPPAPLPTPAAAFEQRLAENPIVPSGAFGGKAPTAHFFSQKSAPPPNMGSSSQQSSFPSPPGDDSQSKWLNMDENQKKRVAADAYKAFEKSLKNSRPDQNKGPKGGSALGSTGLGGRGAVASKGQTDSPASSAPASAPANPKQRQASQVEDERNKHQEMVRAASKQQSAPKSAAATSSTPKSNTTSKQTQQQSAEQIQASAAQASAKRMSLAERAAKAEQDRKDRERQMKAEARRARDAQYASRGPSLSERAAQPDQDREIREAQLKEQARKAQEAQRVEELTRAQEAQHLEELKRAAEADAKRVVEIKRAEDLKRKADADLQSALELERRLAAEMANPDAAPTKQKSEGRLETREQIEAALLGAEEEQGEQQWPVEKKKRQVTGQGFKKEKVAAGAKKKRVVAGYNVVVMKDPKGSVDMPQILEGSLKDLLKGDQSNSNRRRSSMGDNNY